MTVTQTVAEACVLAAGVRKGLCTWCGRKLPKGLRAWCTPLHEWAFSVNHGFAFGARAIKVAVGHCQMCGKGPEPEVRNYGARENWTLLVHVLNRVDGLEADHIERAHSSHGVFGCQHHWSNLRVLCHECHVGVTTQQKRDDANAARLQKGGGVQQGLALD